MKKSKKKLCKLRGCKVRFTPHPLRPMQNVCSPECAWKYEDQKKEDKKKAQRKLDKKRLDELRPASFWANKAQVACNKYIRERDKDEPCISCGTTNTVKYDAGHYYGRKSHPELRFHPSNIHKQCSNYCNKNLSGNIENYRPKLIEKVGVETVDYIENFNVLQHLTRDDYNDIELFYKDRLKYMW